MTRPSASDTEAAGNQTEAVRWALTQTRRWAVVGCSPKPARDSHRVAGFLQRHGFRIFPIHPRCDALLGEACYPDLASLPDEAGVEVVDIFRRSEQAGAHVDAAIAIGARAVWLQLGVVDEAAAARARAAGLRVIMDRCPAIELPRLQRAAGPS